MVHCPVPATLLCQGRRLLQAGGEGLRRERAGQYALSVPRVSREDFRFQQEGEATGGTVWMYACVCAGLCMCVRTIMCIHVRYHVAL